MSMTRKLIYRNFISIKSIDVIARALMFTMCPGNSGKTRRAGQPKGWPFEEHGLHGITDVLQCSMQRNRGDIWRKRLGIY